MKTNTTIEHTNFDDLFEKVSQYREGLSLIRNKLAEDLDDARIPYEREDDLNFYVEIRGDKLPEIIIKNDKLIDKLRNELGIKVTDPFIEKLEKLKKQ